ncbi:MAG: hypothetical protein E6J79_21085, partial [Deltaproteobacteria bacterium]
MTLARARLSRTEILAACALFVALASAHLVALARSPLLDHLTLDLKTYDAWARRILAGDLLGKRVFYQDPLYPYLVAVVYRILGASVVRLLAVQIAVTAVTLAATARLAERVFSTTVARVALWASALYGPAIYYAAKPEKAAFAAAFVVLAFTVVVKAHRAERAATWAAAGALFGLGSLLRGNLVIVAVAVVALILFWRRFAAERRLASAAAFLAGFFVVLAPVLLRNRIVGDDWVFTTSQAGANWFIGNNAGNPDGTYAVPYFVRPSPDYEEIDFRREAERRSGRPLRPSEVSRFWVSEVLRWAVREPGRFLKLQGIKALAFLDCYEYPDNWRSRPSCVSRSSLGPFSSRSARSAPCAPSAPRATRTAPRWRSSSSSTRSPSWRSSSSRATGIPSPSRSWSWRRSAPPPFRPRSASEDSSPRRPARSSSPGRSPSRSARASTTRRSIARNASTTWRRRWCGRIGTPREPRWRGGPSLSIRRARSRIWRW